MALLEGGKTMTDVEDDAACSDVGDALDEDEVISLEMIADILFDFIENQRAFNDAVRKAMPHIALPQ
jgi:hypothetical protein